MEDGRVVLRSLASEAPESSDDARATRHTAPIWGDPHDIVLAHADGEGRRGAAGRARTSGIVQVAWASDGSWLYAGAADGSLYAVEASQY